MNETPSPCATPKSGSYARVALIFGALIVSTMAIFLRLIERHKHKHPAESIRQLTIWNLFISGLALMSIVLFVQSPSPHLCNWLVILGVAVISLNVFVMIARAALLAFRANRSAWVWLLDMVSHYFWPLATIVIFGLVLNHQRGAGNASLGSTALKGLMIFIGILLMWLLINLILYQVCGTWAYRSKAGHPHTLCLKKWMGLLGMIFGSFGIGVLIVYIVVFKKSEKKFNGHTSWSLPRKSCGSKSGQAMPSTQTNKCAWTKEPRGQGSEST